MQDDSTRFRHLSKLLKIQLRPLFKMAGSALRGFQNWGKGFLNPSHGFAGLLQARIVW
jgi:hypothetical protein